MYFPPYKYPPSEPLFTSSDLQLKENNEEAVDGGNDEDVPVEFSMLIVIGVNYRGLLTDQKSVGDRLVYDEAWDETAELLIIDEVKECKVGKNEISGGKIKSSEVGGREVGGRKVGGREVGRGEVRE